MENVVSQSGELKKLVKSIKKDDSQAFKTLYFHFFELLIRSCYLRTHSMELSKDLVQETFTRVWLNRSKLDENQSIKSYLFKILTNLIIDHYKSHGNKTESFEFHKSIVEDKSDQDSVIDLNEAVSKLPDTQKEVFVLSRFDGFKYSEIAELCEISEKAVEKRMSQALKTLRNFFQKK